MKNREGKKRETQRQRDRERGRDGEKREGKREIERQRDRETETYCIF
jgi:hypothetical protein